MNSYTTIIIESADDLNYLATNIENLQKIGINLDYIEIKNACKGTVESHHVKQRIEQIKTLAKLNDTSIHTPFNTIKPKEV